MVIEAPALTRPVLTLGQAVDASDVSRSTLRRWLQAGKVPGATRTEDGGWAIPVDGLLAAGAHLHNPRTSARGVNTDADRVHDASPVDALREELGQLRLEVVVARAQREKAEAIAEERGRALDDARRMLRMLEAGPVPAHGTPVEPVHDTPAEPWPEQAMAPPRQHWWRRRH